MIVSISRRTDIPAFYSEWLLNRIRDGYVMVRNPMNAHSISKINLSPQVVDCIVFWTKNPRRIINKLHFFNDYTYYFQFTITPYGQQLEPNLPENAQLINIFKDLSQQIGRKRVVWRYDPIILTSDIDISFHIKQFSDIAKKLEGFTDRCVISFLDLYKKCERNLYGIPLQTPSQHDLRYIAQNLSNIARHFDIQVVTCAEDIDLTEFGIMPGKCIDDKLISEISGRELDIKKDKSQRKECGCVASVDIGSYNTCSHGCLYCYANYNSKLVKRNLSLHDSRSPLLYGEVGTNDKITTRKMISCFTAQQSLFT